MSTFRVATYNIGDGPDDAKIHHLEQLDDRYAVTVVGCQEGSDRSKMRRRFRRRNRSWRSYGPRLLPGGAAVPILWDDDEWERTAARSVLAVKRRWVGPRGAGPSVVKTKRINVLELRHRHMPLGLTVLNTHFLPSASRPGLPAAERAARQEHYRDHVDAIVRELRRIHGSVVLTMDANANPDWPLLQDLKAAGLTGWTQRPTHGHDTYDYVLARGLVLVDERYVEGGSDHRTVMHAYLTQEHR
jgi:hypothetical protein